MSDCDMRCGEPYDFAWCVTHDTTFPLGEVCQHAATDGEA